MIVENGVPARTVAAYIDLNPVRAGMVSDPADYRWSGYGEAVAAGGRTAEPGFAVEMGFAGMLMRRVRYFSDGAAIGGKECVDLCFEKARDRFGPKRKTGARKLRGTAAEAAGVLWTARNLQKNVK